jgi:hypothetical protein
MNCIKCNSKIRFQNIALENNEAKCLLCNTKFHIADEIVDEIVDSINISNPSCDIQARTEGENILFYASTKTWMSFLFLPITAILLFLNLIFISIVLRSFSWLYLGLTIGFLIALISMFWLCIMSLIGKVELTFEGFNLKIFSGFWKIGTTKNIELKKVKDVEVGFKYDDDGDALYDHITLLMDRGNYSFKPILFNDSFEFLVHILKKAIFYAKSNRTLKLDLNLLHHLIENK